MSLVDALLLDPYPLNVWIAYRTDGISTPGDGAIGIQVTRCARALVEDNLIDLVEPLSIRHQFAQDIGSFNNQTSSGEKLRVYDVTLPGTATPSRELDEEIEAVSLLTI